MVSEPENDFMNDPRDLNSLPESVLYAISARIGGTGLDAVALETLRGLYRERILGRAVAYDNRQREIPSRYIKTLRWSRVRAFSFLESKFYYGAKRQFMERITAPMLARGGFDLFHGWTGECLQTLRLAKEKGIPTVLEIPTWHRTGRPPSPEDLRAPTSPEGSRWQRWKSSLLVSNARVLEEYELADLIFVLSECAKQSFLNAGISEEKLFPISRGVDVEKFTPAAAPPPIFRAIFIGALIKRKGVHLLLEAWRKLNLKNAELLLVGYLHDEMKPFVREFADDSVKLVGFSKNTPELLRSASAHVFPSFKEGCAKVTLEAAACGLPQITTRESGDVVVDGLNGIIVPARDGDALTAAIERLYGDPDLRARMGAAARQRAVENFTWDHFRANVLRAYRRARSSR